MSSNQGANVPLSPRRQGTIHLYKHYNPQQITHIFITQADDEETGIFNYRASATVAPTDRYLRVQPWWDGGISHHAGEELRRHLRARADYPAYELSEDDEDYEEEIEKEDRERDKEIAEEVRPREEVRGEKIMNMRVDTSYKRSIKEWKKAREEERKERKEENDLIEKQKLFLKRRKRKENGALETTPEAENDGDDGDSGVDEDDEDVLETQGNFGAIGENGDEHQDGDEDEGENGNDDENTHGGSEDELLPGVVAKLEPPGKVGNIYITSPCRMRKYCRMLVHVIPPKYEQVRKFGPPKPHLAKELRKLYMGILEALSKCKHEAIAPHPDDSSPPVRRQRTTQGHKTLPGGSRASPMNATDAEAAEDEVEDICQYFPARTIAFPVNLCAITGWPAHQEARIAYRAIQRWIKLRSPHEHEENFFCNKPYHNITFYGRKDQANDVKAYIRTFNLEFITNTYPNGNSLVNKWEADDEKARAQPQRPVELEKMENSDMPTRNNTGFSPTSARHRVSGQVGSASPTPTGRRPNRRGKRNNENTEPKPPPPPPREALNDNGTRRKCHSYRIRDQKSGETNFCGQYIPRYYGTCKDHWAPPWWIPKIGADPAALPSLDQSSEDPLKKQVRCLQPTEERQRKPDKKDPTKPGRYENNEKHLYVGCAEPITAMPRRREKEAGAGPPLECKYHKDKGCKTYMRHLKRKSRKGDHHKKDGDEQQAESTDDSQPELTRDLNRRTNRNKRKRDEDDPDASASGEKPVKRQRAKPRGTRVEVEEDTEMEPGDVAVAPGAEDFLDEPLVDPTMYDLDLDTEEDPSSEED